MDEYRFKLEVVLVFKESLPYRNCSHLQCFIHQRKGFVSYPAVELLIFDAPVRLWDFELRCQVYWKAVHLCYDLCQLGCKISAIVVARGKWHARDLPVANKRFIVVFADELEVGNLHRQGFSKFRKQIDFDLCGAFSFRPLREPENQSAVDLENV